MHHEHATALRSGPTRCVARRLVADRARRGVAQYERGTLPLPPNTIRQMFGCGVRAGMYPMTPQQAYWYICVNAAEVSAPKARAETVGRLHASQRHGGKRSCRNWSATQRSLRCARAPGVAAADAAPAARPAPAVCRSQGRAAAQRCGGVRCRGAGCCARLVVGDRAGCAQHRPRRHQQSGHPGQVRAGWRKRRW
jgi:hypothetical protein